MKVIITERQIKKLIDYQLEKELEEQDIPDMGSSEDEEYPSSTTKWEDVRTSISRGVANPVDVKKRHKDYPEAEPTRGVANQLE